MTQIITNLTSYSEHRPEDGIKDNWAAEYAKREVDKHRKAEVLDHPDGSVTDEKLSDGLRARISEAYETAQTASETANTAKDVAQSAKSSADIAVKESENAYEKSLAAHEKASTAENIANTAKNNSETAEQRATSAEAKADTAVAAASSAVQKTENAQTELSKHSSDEDVHISAEEKENIYADIKEARDIAVHADVYASETCEHMYVVERTMENNFGYMDTLKADKPILSTSGTTALIYDFAERDNNVAREGELESVSFVFTNDAYDELFISELTFDSGDTPTVVDFPYEDNEVIINWYGTDCAIQEWTDDEGNHNIAPIFQPSANTRYNIMFWFDGADLVGKVHGYVPANRNVVSE